MTFKNQDRGAADSPELIDIADLEEITSTSKEEPTRRETNDRRLAQAINYLVEEGGSDSPATFMDRVDRIDNSLLLPLNQQGRNFDMKLFNRVLDMVSQAQLDFDEAAQEDSSEEDSPSMSNRESSMPESAEELREYYTPSAAEALYWKGDSLDKPHSKPHMSVPATKGPAAERGEDVPSERVFKYGGPDNEVESWYKDYPASLPFPETFQLAHWESLKINYDISESGKQMKAEGQIVETNVSFDHPALQQYKTLPPYESGSRFKLPKPSAIVEEEVNRLGTQESLEKVVQDLNRSSDEVNAEGKYRYTPRIFLEKFTVGAQVDPTAIRHAVNTTPTKARTNIIGNISQRDSANSTRKGPAVRTPTTQTSKHPQGSTKHTTLVPPTSRAQTASPVVRKINRERATSLERSPRRQSGVSTVPPSPDSPTKKIAVHPQVVIEKRVSDRPKKPAAPVSSKPQIAPDSINFVTQKGTAKKLTKRKRSISERDYTVDHKRSKPVNPSVPRSSVRTRAQGTSYRSVPFVAEESDELDDSGEGDVTESLNQIPAAVIPVKVKTATKSKVTKSRAATKKVTKKATIAGKVVGKAQRKVVVKEITDEGNYALPITQKQKTKLETKAGSTRSGLRYLKE
ncbi:hypothetical protein AG0111_0g3911 [Alternaria gaisen]|uniref:Uncharacterized protein n=1 Tax=Alternaria gaisen TaxID=167740 RepID=A0ACB6FUU0_9PLEO|nr:hypothetical protein AG0111_0g3911 [Alternaria gaisen]